MHSRGFLLLLVVTFVALTSRVTYAKNAVWATNVEDVSNPSIRSDDSNRRNLKAKAAVVYAGTLEDEERGIKLPSFLTKIFYKSPKASNVVKNSPDVAKALKDPKVRQTVKELAGKKGLAASMRNLPGVKQIAERLRRKPGPVTTADVKEVGAVAMKSSGTWKDKVLSKYGPGLVVALGVFVMMAIFYPILLLEK